MAGLGLSAFALSPQHAPANLVLPTGPCSHTSVATGSCGCEQFWDKGSAELHHGSTQRRSSSERSTWCVCGHHACFHKTIAPAAPARAPARCDGGYRQQAGVQCDLHKPLRPRPEQLRQNGASHADGTQMDDEGQEVSSQPSTSGLPRVPSLCLLSNDRYPKTNRDVRSRVGQSQQSLNGLGLSTTNAGEAGHSIGRPQSVASTIPDDFDMITKHHGSLGGSEMPSTRANSVMGEQARVASPAFAQLEAIVEYNSSLRLDTCSDKTLNTFHADEFIQSATEVATPSNANTPDLAAADQAMDEGRKFVESLMQFTANSVQRAGSEGRLASVTSAPSPHLLLAKSPGPSAEQLHNMIGSASPQALQKMVSYLAPLHNLLNSMPSVANAIREVNDRLSMLENNNSFLYVHPDELHQQLEAYDGRLLDVENRMDEHDRVHQAIDADHSSNSYNKRVVHAVTESFTSNRSLESTTSSALILAAIDRKDMAAEIGGIKDRLDVLEAAAMPTSATPWDVEVVLLPWGSQLRGIWFAPDEPMLDLSKSTTQDAEEWTQARSAILGQFRSTVGPLRESDSSPPPGNSHSSKSSHPFSEAESGWSSQDISVWAAGSSDDLLSPKACGSNGLVFKRLRSRGFVKDVSIKSVGAQDLQATLSHAFRHLLPRLRYTNDREDTTVAAFPGLRASFIPLRKVLHDSRLRFLSPAEMANSALWNAQFLASGILMRVSGGKKRLYVTQRDAYVQSDGGDTDEWTWQGIRQLPRHRTDVDAAMEGNDEQCQPQVAEADAKEACWGYFQAYDGPPLSLNTSFESRRSAELSVRPADRSWRRSMTPTSILKNRPPQPISPLSEIHPRPDHHRTVSASVVEPIVSGSSKRRFNSSPVKQSSVQPTLSRAPSFSLSRPKRRRVADSSSPRPGSDAHEAQATIWANTPRRSREPPSPFHSAGVPLPRTNSDLASRPSQRSVGVMGKGTPSAYATPHSGAFGGPVFGAGDTEADDGMYQDDDDDGELSWRGVTTTGDEDSASDDDDDVKAGAELDLEASFSGDESAFGLEEENEVESCEEEGEQALRGDEYDDDDPLDTLLDVLRDSRC